jgi:probable HAF family extracellular repeat protein
VNTVWILLLASISTCWLQAAFAEQATTQYTIEDKGLSLVRQLTDTPGLNNQGDFAIWHEVSASSMPAVIFHGDHSLTIAGTEDYSLVYPADLNDRLTVVGTLQQPQDLRFTQAFVWSNNHLQILPTLGGRYAVAGAINAAGNIAGTAQTPSGARHAVLWHQNQVRDLGLLAAGDYSSAHDINDRNNIAGEANVTPNGKPQAFFWHAGRMQLLPNLSGGHVCSAQAINHADTIVGSCDQEHGIAHAVRWQHGAIQDLGSLGDEDAPVTALDINDHDQVVGSASLDDKLRAFLWDRGKMQDLNKNLPPHSGWLLLVASRINNQGVIVGRGYYQGYIHAFLMRPVPSLDKK